MSVSNNNKILMYDEAFYTYTERISLRSARVVLPAVMQYFNVRSVVDFGCGTGSWLAAWKDFGATDCIGVDGDYVDGHRLSIDRDIFVAHDLCQPCDLGRKFDLVQSIEVGEHLPEASADTFVDTLALHGDVILFSAAAPGQGGMDHINEQPYSYWQDKFDRRGFMMFDLIRPAIQNDPNVLPWHRYNIFVYIRDSLIDQLSDEIKSRRISRDQTVPDVSSLRYKARKAVLRCFPVGTINFLSRVNTWLSNIKATAR